MLLAALPDGYAARVPTIGDSETVTDLIAECRLAVGDRSGMTVEELLGDWHDITLSEEAVAVEAPDGCLAAYADVLNRSYVSVSVYGYVHPEHRRRGLGTFIVGWGEEWVRERLHLAPWGARVVVQHYVHTADEPAARLMERMDYTPVRGCYRMNVELDGTPPQPEWPDGIRVRTFVPGRDEKVVYDSVEDAFCDVWGRPRGTFERFLGLTRVEGFDHDLWFVAESRGGISGVCLCKVVGVRSPWRGMGLGLALLRHALGEFYRRGVQEVGLGVYAASVTGAPRLYGRAGMHVAESFILCQKELRPGRDPDAT